MLILGVCNATDSGACLIEDGRIVACANEERFNRRKNTSAFPEHAIRYVLESQQASLSDVDWIGCGTWHGIDPCTTLPRLVEDCWSYADPSARETVLHRIRTSSERDSDARRRLLEGLAGIGASLERLVFCDHHLSHALTAFYCSPYEEAIVFSADGRGDFKSVALYEASRREGLRLLEFVTDLASPGAMYGFITKYLGFTPDRHEGKVTGLSARGRMSPAYAFLKEGFYFDSDTGRIHSRIGRHYQPFTGASWPGLSEGLMGISREDVAFAAQRLLEEALLGFLLHHTRNRGPINLCLAGGCMSNVKLNFELSRLATVGNMYVFPQMGDGGSALGGALHVAVTKTGHRHFDLPTVYLGPEYSDTDIAAALMESNIKHRLLAPADKVPLAVEQLAAGKIVGWFQGRMEYGPRALGSRSILATATDVSIHDILNRRLSRSEFMPFAPVTIPELAGRCFKSWAPDQPASRFMTTCYECTDYFEQKCPAVVHVDRTARPQVVFREQNPDYYDVVKAYYDRTGIPALINTSFNHHEEPIVNTPYDALRSLRKGNVDVLIAGNYVCCSA